MTMIRSRLEKTAKEFQTNIGKDIFIAEILDVTNAQSILSLFQSSVLAFGGVDIMVNCAGLSISKPIEEHTEKDWDLLYDVLVKGQFLVTPGGC